MGDVIDRDRSHDTVDSIREAECFDSLRGGHRVRVLWSLLIAALATACAADASDASPGSAITVEAVEADAGVPAEADGQDPVVAIALDEFVVIGPTELDAGQVTLAVENDGTENHQLTIVAAESYETLPRRENGSVDTEEVDASRVLLATEPLFAGFPAESFTVDIEAGTYVFFCALQSFIGDESHVRLGQRSIVTVK